MKATFRRYRNGSGALLWIFQDAAGYALCDDPKVLMELLAVRPSYRNDRRPYQEVFGERWFTPVSADEEAQLEEA